MSLHSQARPPLPPERFFFPGEKKRGICPDASDEEISTSTDTDVRKTQANSYRTHADHLHSSCAHHSNCERSNTHRANPAPSPDTMEKNIQKESLFVAEWQAVKS